VSDWEFDIVWSRVFRFQVQFLVYIGKLPGNSGIFRASVVPVTPRTGNTGDRIIMGEFAYESMKNSMDDLIKHHILEMLRKRVAGEEIDNAFGAFIKKHL
jgi:hypothetical protein